MLHLVESIEELGPPIRYSCFSFEAAHKYFKSLAKSQNFKNLPLSLANRFQYLSTCNFAGNSEGSSHPLFNKEKIFGVVTRSPDEEKHRLRATFDSLNLLPGISFTNVHKTSWVIKFGTKYCREAFIAVDADPMTKLPVFGKIVGIYIVHDFVYFEIMQYKTQEFCFNYQAYLVEVTEQKSFKAYGSLIDYNVYHMKTDSNENQYIQPKYSLSEMIDCYVMGVNPIHF